MDKSIDELLLKKDWFSLWIDKARVLFQFPFRHPSTQLHTFTGGLVGLDVNVANRVIEPALIQTIEDIRLIQETRNKEGSDDNSPNVSIYEDNCHVTKLPAPENLSIVEAWLQDKKAKERKWYTSDGPAFEISWFPIQGFLKVNKFGLGVGVGNGIGSELSPVLYPTHLKYSVVPFSKEFIDSYQLAIEDEVSYLNGEKTGRTIVTTAQTWNIHNMEFPARLFSRNFALEYNNEFLRQQGK